MGRKYWSGRTSDAAKGDNPVSDLTAGQLVDKIAELSAGKDLNRFAIYHDEYTDELRMVDLDTLEESVIG